MKCTKGIIGAALVLASVVCDPNNWNLVTTGFAMLMFIIGLGLLFMESAKACVACGSEY